MLELIRNIEGNFITNVIGNINYAHSIEAELQREDYINIFGLVCFLQNLAMVEETAALSIPNEFGYQVQFNQIVTDLDFSTCNRTAVWYNMQESPDFMMLLSCGLIMGSPNVKFTINSFKINGIEHIKTPLTTNVNAINANWIPANNDVISGCTLGGITGITYTDFVDFLNKSFWDLGVNYQAQISLIERDLGSHSKSGFYITFPKTDKFYLQVTSNTGTPYPLTYTHNDLLYSGYNLGYYKLTTDVEYDCDLNTITE